MAIKDFAAAHRLRLNYRKHEQRFGLSTSEDTVHGRFGEIVEDPSYGSVLAVKFIAVPRTAVKTHALRSRYRQGLAGGLTLKRKYGDDESTFHFGLANPEQAALAIKLVGAGHKRQVSLTDAQRQALAVRLAAVRKKTQPVPCSPTSSLPAKDFSQSDPS